MALLYPWATKEYCLWEMTIGQLVMYHNIGLELKYPSPDAPKKGSLAAMTKDERKAAIMAARESMRQERAKDREAENEARKEPYRAIYGDV